MWLLFLAGIPDPHDLQGLQGGYDSTRPIKIESVVKLYVAGEVAEWLMAPVLKTGIPERVSGVRIPPSPPVL